MSYTRYPAGDPKHVLVLGLVRPIGRRILPPLSRTPSTRSDFHLPAFRPCAVAAPGSASFVAPLIPPEWRAKSQGANPMPTPSITSLDAMAVLRLAACEHLLIVLSAWGAFLGGVGCSRQHLLTTPYPPAPFPSQQPCGPHFDSHPGSCRSLLNRPGYKHRGDRMKISLMDERGKPQSVTFS